MIRRFHLPNRIAWTGAPSDQERAIVERVVLEAARQAITRAAGSGSIFIEAPAEIAREPFDLARFNQERGSYRVPSYDNEGVLVDVPAESTISFEDETVVGHPDNVIEHEPPFQRSTVMSLPGNQYIFVRSHRYATTSDIGRAYTWGRVLFGAGAFVIASHSVAPGDLLYYVAALDRPLSQGDLSVQRSGGRPGLPGGAGEFFSGRILDELPGGYNVVAVGFHGGGFSAPSREALAAFTNQVRESRELGMAALEPQLARTHVFQTIDDLITMGGDYNLQRAADLLAELDANAFALVGWEVKVRYLQVLVQAWTYEPQEVAIVEIMKSLRDLTELRAVLDLLRRAGIYDQLFADMDSQLWSLLTAVGERLGQEEQITFQLLIELMQEAGLFPRDLGDLARMVTLGPSGVTAGPDGLADMEEAARSFVRFLGGTVDAVGMLLTEPGRVVEGIVQLVRLQMTMYAAQLGHQESRQEVEGFLRNIGRQLVFGYRGARVLGVTGAVFRRIKWALIWEIASMFVGVGEVRAAIGALGLARRAAALGRLTRLLRGLGAVADIERVMARLDDLVRLLRPVRQLGNEADILRLFSYLPEDDMARLARALESADLAGIDNLAALAARNPALAEAADFAVRRAEVIAELERRAGGLSDNVVAGFHRMANRGGFSHDELLGWVREIPTENAERVMRAVRSMPDSAFGRRVGARSLGFFENLARSPKACTFLSEAGYETFSALYRHSGYNIQRFEEYLDALADIARGSGSGGGLSPADYRRFLDRLRDADTAAYRELRNAVNSRRTAAGLRQIRTFSAAELDEIVRTTPDIRRIRELAAGMDNSSSGSLFERWANHYIFHQPVGSPRLRLHVRLEDNPGLELYSSRSSDFFLDSDGSIWDAKIYQSAGEVPYFQAYDYGEMVERGWVITTDGRRVQVQSINYIFSDRAAAEANRLVDMFVDIWYLADDGSLHLQR